MGSSSPTARVARFSQQKPPNRYSKQAQIQPNRVLGVFLVGFLVKFAFQGAKYHVTGVALTRGNNVKVAKFREKTTDQATLPTACMQYCWVDLFGHRTPSGDFRKSRLKAMSTFCFICNFVTFAQLVALAKWIGLISMSDTEFCSNLKRYRLTSGVASLRSTFLVC